MMKATKMIAMLLAVGLLLALGTAARAGAIEDLGGRVEMWLDATDPGNVQVNGSGHVTSWTDLANPGRTIAPASPGAGITYQNTGYRNTGAVVVGSSNESMDLSSPQAAVDKTFITVFQADLSPSNKQHVLGGNLHPVWHGWRQIGTGWRGNFDGTYRGSGDYWGIQSWYVNAAAATGDYQMPLYFNGQWKKDYNFTDTGNTATNIQRLFANNDNYNNAFNGNLSQAVVIQGTLDNDDRRAVERQVASAYAKPLNPGGAGVVTREEFGCATARVTCVDSGDAPLQGVKSIEVESSDGQLKAGSKWVGDAYGDFALTGTFNPDGWHGWSWKWWAPGSETVDVGWFGHKSQFVRDLTARAYDENGNQIGADIDLGNQQNFVHYFGDQTTYVHYNNSDVSGFSFDSEVQVDFGLDGGGDVIYDQYMFENPDVVFALPDDPDTQNILTLALLPGTDMGDIPNTVFEIFGFDDNGQFGNGIEFLNQFEQINLRIGEDVSSLLGDQNWDLSNLYTEGTIAYTGAAEDIIPEPTSAVLVFLGFGAVASRVRRRLRVG